MLRPAPPLFSLIVHFWIFQIFWRAISRCTANRSLFQFPADLYYNYHYDGARDNLSLNYENTAVNRRRVNSICHLVFLIVYLEMSERMTLQRISKKNTADVSADKNEGWNYEEGRATSRAYGFPGAIDFRGKRRGLPGALRISAH